MSVAIIYAIAASPSLACELAGFSASGETGGAVRPGDPVKFTIYARATQDSPADSPYTVSIGSQLVGSGEATPSKNGGEWSTSESFPMPDLGDFEGSVTVTVALQTGGNMTTSLQYDGTAAPAAAPSQSAAETTPAAAGTQIEQRGNASATPTGASGAQPLTDAQPTRSSAAPSPAVVQGRKHVAVAARPLEQGPVAGVTGTVRAVAVPLAARSVSGPFPAEQRQSGTATPSRAVSGSRPQSAPKGWSHQRRNLDYPAPAASDVQRGVARVRASAPTPTWLIALALVLLIGGGGAAWRSGRRQRRPDRPDSEAQAVDDAIEAELQALIADHVAASGEREEPAPLVPI